MIILSRFAIYYSPTRCIYELCRGSDIYRAVIGKRLWGIQGGEKKPLALLQALSLSVSLQTLSKQECPSGNARRRNALRCLSRLAQKWAAVMRVTQNDPAMYSSYSLH